MPRRPNNDGSVYFDKSQGYWVATVPYLRSSGARYYKKSKHRTQREAEAARKALVANRGEISKSQESMTMSQWIDFVRTHVWPKSGWNGRAISPKTRDGYEWLIRDYIEPAFGPITIADITAIKIELWLSRIEKDATRSACYRLMKSLFSRAVRPYRLIPYSPMDSMAPPSYSPEPDRILSSAEISKLIASGIPPQIEGIIRVAVATGMRVSEIIALGWHQVDLSSRTIVIDRQYDQITKSYRPPKSGKPRVVPIPPSVAGWLYDWRSSSAGELVFATKAGTPLMRRNVLRSFVLALDHAGLPRVKFHSLRKSSSTILLEIGADPKVRQQMLGHSRSETTDSIYTIAGTELLRAAADLADKSIFGDTTLPGSNGE